MVQSRVLLATCLNCLRMEFFPHRSTANRTGLDLSNRSAFSVIELMAEYVVLRFSSVSASTVVAGNAELAGHI
jgi:hypothetical protein